MAARVCDEAEDGRIKQKRLERLGNIRRGRVADNEATECSHTVNHLSASQGSMEDGCLIRRVIGRGSTSHFLGKPLLFLIRIQARVLIVNHSRNIEQFRHGPSDLQNDGSALLVWDVLSHIIRKRLQKQPRRKCHPFERRRLVSVHAQPQASIAARRERYVWLNWPKLAPSFAMSHALIKRAWSFGGRNHQDEIGAAFDALAP
jgi:hypothetical protein